MSSAIHNAVVQADGHWSLSSAGSRWGLSIKGFWACFPSQRPVSGAGASTQILSDHRDSYLGHTTEGKLWYFEVMLHPILAYFAVMDQPKRLVT